MNNPQALVLVWWGDEPSDYLVSKIAEVLTANEITKPEMLSATYLDTAEITKLGLEEAIRQCKPKHRNKIKPVTKPEEQALIYISGIVDFASSDYRRKIIESAINPTKEFEAAVDIIKDSKYDAVMLSKYGIPWDAIKLIRNLGLILN